MRMLADLGKFDRAPIHEKHLGIVESREQPGDGRNRLCTAV